MNSMQKETVVAEVWIPLRRYKLTLRYKLLNELGEISHFILKALHQTSLTLNDFELITGLSKQQLSPVWERLKGLRLIDSQGQLTKPSGESIAYILENLHQKTVCFWLDRRYHTEKRAMLMIKGDSYLVNELSKVVIKEPKEAEWEWDTDCFYQSERLRKSIHDVLPWLFQAFEQLPNIETIKWGQEWELDLQPEKKDKGCGLPIKLELSHQILEKPAISLFTRVLTLETCFEFAQGIDFSQSIECPKPLKFQYSFIESEFYQDLPYVAEVDLDMTIETPSAPTNRDIAMQMLTLCHKETNEEYSKFNRQHSFREVWQQNDISWQQVCEHLPKTNAIYQTYIQGEKIENN